MVVRRKSRTIPIMHSAYRSQAEMKILCCIATNGPTKRSFLESEGIVAPGTAYQVADEMVSNGLLVKRTLRKDKEGKETALYRLTVRGLAAVLEQTADAKRFEMIASKSDCVLPLVLGIWPCFKKAGLDERAAHALRRAARAMTDFCRLLGDPMALGEEEDRESYFREFLSDVFLFEMLRERSCSTTIAWMKTIREHAELKEAAISNYEGQLRKARLWAGRLREILTILRSKSEPNWGSASRELKRYPLVSLVGEPVYGEILDWTPEQYAARTREKMGNEEFRQHRERKGKRA